MAAKDEVGRYGEQVAARHLADDGWHIIARNWRGKRGELDIIALEGRELVVVEVKTRRTATFGSPAEAVTPAKVQRLRRLTAEWLSEQEQRFAGVRIDVMSVMVARAGAATVEHLRGVA